ncbi:MAG: glycosyl hydrolase 53 family protein [Desulfurococcaceae archaeon]
MCIMNSTVNTLFKTMRVTIIILLIISVISIKSPYYLRAESEIQVNPVEGLPHDFIRGVDLSEVPWIIELGGKYYDVNGIEKNVLDILVESGVNWIRLRVWNDPYDEQGKPYGGGNCDLRRMTSFAAIAKSKGFKILIDFHYSDWWADPGKQNKPKAWTNLTFNELVEAVYNWTYYALKYMQSNGALPDMVQIGNEINNGFLWPEGRAENWTQFTDLLKSAIKAVRDVDPEIKIVIHLAGVKSDFYKNFLSRLIDSGVNFDIVGISYYPYWHGSMDEFRKLVKTLAENFDKGIIVAETAYAWTLQDADGHPNLFGSRDQEVKGGYLATVQGQASFIRDLIEAFYLEGGGKALGIFYWGAGWIPYPGAGWRTGEGNPWENQAFFDFNGRALPSLTVFKLIYEGKKFEIKPVELYDDKPINITAYIGVKPILPNTVLVVYSDHSIRMTPVDWGLIPTYNATGVYEYAGYIANTSIKVTALINVIQRIYLEITDPEGDDKGPGTYGYPTAAVYKPGVFDLLKTTLSVEDEYVIIRFYFKDLGDNPWNGPNGFSLQYIQMYIRTTNPIVTNKAYRVDTFGLNIKLNEDYAWQYAILISPGWGTAPLVNGELSAIYYSSGEVFVEDKDFDVSANIAENYVEVKIPRTILPDWENLVHWKIFIAVTSWAGENPDRIRSFAPGGGEWVIDPTAYADPNIKPKIASAILSGVLPKAIDIQLYSEEYPNGITAEQQYNWLMNFDPAKNAIPIIPPPKLPYVTITSVQTITQTIVLVETLTRMIEQTHTLKETETLRVEIPTYRFEQTIAIALITLAIGLILGYLVKVRKST